MCYTSASAAKAGAKEALANGTLILLIPPMVFFALITVVVYKFRNKFRETPIEVRLADRMSRESDADSERLSYLLDRPVTGSPDRTIRPWAR